MANTVKTYPFSVQKHAHDIELYRNHLYSTMRDMEDGEIAWDDKFVDWYEAFYYGDLQDLYEMMFSSRDGRVVYLTGKQIGLAKEIVTWASNRRAASLIKAGKTQYLQYC